MIMHKELAENADTIGMFMMQPLKKASPKLMSPRDFEGEKKEKQMVDKGIRIAKEQLQG